MFLKVTVVLCGVLVWVLGCSRVGGSQGLPDAVLDAARVHTDAPDSDGDQNGSVNGVEWLLSEWCGPFAVRVCEAARSCGCTQAPGFPEAQCESAARAFCGMTIERLAQPLSDGRLVLRPQALADCLATLDAAFARCTIPDPFAFSVSCVLFAAPAEYGEACEGGLCAEGQGYCAPPGRCEPLPGEGQECVASLCAKGLRCDEGTCRKPRGLGEACERERQCQEGLWCQEGKCAKPHIEKPFTKCADPSVCGQNLFCVATMRRACAARPKVGEPCFGEECPEGAYCHNGVCTLSPGLGEPCGDGVACAPGLACDMTTSTCREIPGLGQPCALGRYGPVVCGEGFACFQGVCVPIPTAGEPCAQGPDGFPVCAEGLGCDFRNDGTSVCAKPKGLGDNCTNDSMCSEGLFCDYNVSLCRERKKRGEACSYDAQCGENLTCLAQQVGLGTTCEPVPGLGETCADRCQDGLVCRPVADYGLCLPSVCTAIPF